MYVVKRTLTLDYGYERGHEVVLVDGLQQQRHQNLSLWLVAHQYHTYAKIYTMTSHRTSFARRHFAAYVSPQFLTRHCPKLQSSK